MRCSVLGDRMWCFIFARYWVVVSTVHINRYKTNRRQDFSSFRRLESLGTRPKNGRLPLGHLKQALRRRRYPQNDFRAQQGSHVLLFFLPSDNCMHVFISTTKHTRKLHGVFEGQPWTLVRER